MGLPDPSQRCFRVGLYCTEGCTARSLAECPRRNDAPPPYVHCGHCGARSRVTDARCQGCGRALLAAVGTL